MEQMVLPGKLCTKCRAWKVLDEFALDKRMRDGRRSSCKRCMVQEQSQRRRDNLEAHKARDAQYRAANAQRRRDMARADYWNNHEQRKQSRKARRHLHRQRRRAWNMQWRLANPEKSAAQSAAAGQRRRARQSQSITYLVTAADVRRIRSMPCAVQGCTATDIEVDHIVPISRGGSHSIGNLQPLCKSHNASKGAKLWIEFRAYLSLQQQPQTPYIR